MIYFISLILSLLPTYLIRLSAGGGPAFGGKIPVVPTTVLELLIVVFLVGTIVRLRIKDLSKIKALGKINYAIGLFVLAGIISTIISPEKTKALGQLKAFIVEPILLFYAVLLIIKSKEQLNTVLRWLFISAGLVSLFGIIQYYTLINLPLRFWGNGAEIERITSVFDYPNALALYLAPLFGFYFALFISRYQVFKNKWAEWGIMGVMGLALILTFSRGAWIALGTGLFLILLHKYKAKKVIIPSLILVLLLFLIPGIRQRIGLGISDPSSEAHFGLMQMGIRQIARNPIFGNGLGGFAALNLGVEYPHNIFLNFWVEMGFLGLISFFAICFLVFEKYKKNHSVLTLASGVFITILILHGLVDVPYFKNDLSVLFWFVVGAAYMNI